MRLQCEIFVLNWTTEIFTWRDTAAIIIRLHFLLNFQIKKILSQNWQKRWQHNQLYLHDSLLDGGACCTCAAAFFFSRQCVRIGYDFNGILHLFTGHLLNIHRHKCRDSPGDYRRNLLPRHFSETPSPLELTVFLKVSIFSQRRFTKHRYRWRVYIMHERYISKSPTRYIYVDIHTRESLLFDDLTKKNNIHLAIPADRRDFRQKWYYFVFIFVFLFHLPSLLYLLFSPLFQCLICNSVQKCSRTGNVANHNGLSASQLPPNNAHLERATIKS